MKHLTLLLLAIMAATAPGAAVTLDECLAAAEQNYPAIAKYDLMALTTRLNIEEINRAWLPRISLYGQATLQNDVPAWPDALSDVLAMMNRDIRGLSRFQYKVGADVNQSLWDGGTSAAARRIERARGEVDRASLDVEIYALRERVINLYFGILLMDKQLATSRLTLELINENLRRINSMVANGTATRGDAALVEAQALQMQCNITEAQSASDAYRRVLSAFTAIDLAGDSLAIPEPMNITTDRCDRPELHLLDSRMALQRSLLSTTEASVMPRVSLFAQAYYGYPGFNYFESMMKRNMSLNIMGGIKIAWNIDSFYTRSTARRKMQATVNQLNADRETFLFNTRLRSIELRAEIDKFRDIAATSRRIVELRAEVRRAAQSRLDNGVVDVTDLMDKITQENVAALTASFHELQALQKSYQLSFTLNQ